MADITEVIHKITYEVHDDALQNATKAIQLQMAELQKLSNQLDKYMTDLGKVSASQTNEIERLGRKIEEVSRNIAQTSSKSKVLLQEAFKGIVSGLTGQDGVKESISKYVKGVISEFDKLQAASKQMGIGFAQHMKTAGAASAGVVTTLSNLAKSALSFTNIFGIALSVLSLFSDELFGTKENAEDLADAVDEAAEFSKKLGEESSHEIGKLVTLKSKIEDTTLSYDKRKAAINELRKQYPGYFDHLSNEELLAGKVADAYQKVVQAIVAAARARIYTQKLEETISKVEALKDTIQQLARKHNIELGVTIDKHTDLDRLSLTGQDAKDSEQALLYGRNFSPQQQVDNTGTRKTRIDNFNIDRDRADALSQISSGIIEMNIAIDNVGEYAKAVSKFQEQSQVKPQPDTINPKKDTDTLTVEDTPKPQREQESVTYLDTSRPVNVKQPEFKEHDLPDVTVKDFASIDEARKKEISGQIEGYQQLAQAAADAYNKILQAQIDALDKEIAIREKRVEKAKELAERGNTEALRLEEERLQKAQEKRERFARRQQAVNAAITVSNAIAAVARAALEGGGFGSVATIAALLAALAAGYAAVTSLSGDSSGSFADGVVDFKGKGGPRDDKNWVRISNGESVITAEGTKKNRALLEAINRGAALHMTDPTLPFMMPLFKQPDVHGQQSYAQVRDLKQLESKLDEVVGAIEDNRLRQNIFFNEHGVGLMTERAVSKERKRWK